MWVDLSCLAGGHQICHDRQLSNTEGKNLPKFIMLDTLNIYDFIIFYDKICPFQMVY